MARYLDPRPARRTPSAARRSTRARSRIARSSRAGHLLASRARSPRAAFLVDGEAFFTALAAALERARHQVILLGWDFHGRVRLRRDAGGAQPTRRLPRAPRGAPRAAPRPRDLRARLELRHRSARSRASSSPRLHLGLHAHPRLHFRLDARPPAARVPSPEDRRDRRRDRVLGRLRRDDEPLGHARASSRRRPPHRPGREPVRPVPRRPDGGRRRAPRRPSPSSRASAGSARPGSALAPPPEATPRRLAGRARSPRCARSTSASRAPSPAHGRPPVREIEALFIASVAAAERTIYAESQYLTSDRIVEALGARLGGARRARGRDREPAALAGLARGDLDGRAPRARRAPPARRGSPRAARPLLPAAFRAAASTSTPR